MTRYTETQSEKVQRIKRRIEQVEAKREANGAHSPPEASEHLVIETRRLKALLHELTHEPSRETGLDPGGRQRDMGDTAKPPRGEDAADTSSQETIPTNPPE